MMNLLEAMRIFGAIVEHGGLSGAASELKLDVAQVGARLDGLERYLGCRLLLERSGDAVACTEAGVAFYACCRRTLSAVAQATGASGAEACATVSRSPVAGLPLPETTRCSDGASIAAPTTLHRLTR
ncbi:LysR family transcriptional regulator [Burkholderia orbicola]|nr:MULTISPECIES: LysR family transcriptional regulator [Burkholderia cepacia complex]MDN7471478.1 LysR family transcriptional regulator [Burkholderia orbicola]MDN7501185.1 LysR family transcriptional regulator [Burkholderia orbicola]